MAASRQHSTSASSSLTPSTVFRQSCPVLSGKREKRTLTSQSKSPLSVSARWKPLWHLLLFRCVPHTQFRQRHHHKSSPSAYPTHRTQTGNHRRTYRLLVPSWPLTIPNRGVEQTLTLAEELSCEPARCSHQCGRISDGMASGRQCCGEPEVLHANAWK